MIRVARVTLWVFAFAVAFAAARYFVTPPPLMEPPLSFANPAADAGANLAPTLYRSHRILFLMHVGGGLVALVVGLFQFIGRLRDARPNIHRALGFTYLTAVLAGAAAGLPLSLLILDAVPPAFRTDFFPMAGSFFLLAIAWGTTSAIALGRARARRFREHRAWMMRSYSLTFAAVTVRLVATILSLLTGDVVFAVNSGVLSWPLNLVVAEWLIRRNPQPALAGAVA